MATKPPRRLTPKILEIVATDRLGRPPVSRLTAAQAEQLALVARRRDRFQEPVSSSRAIAALARGRPQAAMPVLRTVLTDLEAPELDRIAAARGLGEIATGEAEALLLRSAGDRDPRVQQAVLTALGWFGGPELVRELGRIQPTDSHARRQLAFSRALAAHRHGLMGPFLARPAQGRSQRPTPSRAIDVSLQRKTQKATADDLGKVRGQMFGIELADRGYALRCGRREWTLFVNKALGQPSDAHGLLAERPWIAAVLCWWYPVRTIATPQYVVLTHPVGAVIAIDVMRRDGETIYAGTAASESSGRATPFSITEVERPGTAPLDVTGRLAAKGIEFDHARAAASRINTRESVRVTA